MYGCSFDVLNDLEFIKAAMLSAIEAANLTLLDFTYHKFEPQGLTAIALLSESHLSIHTYPEFGYAAIDVFTCSQQAKPEIAIHELRHRLKPEKIRTTQLKRGDFGSFSDMKPKIRIHMTPLRRVKSTGEKVLKMLSRNR